MNAPIRAEPGEWYLDRQSGNTFQVVGIDEDAGSIEVQFADGAVGEFLVDDWESMSLARSGQPEDWAGPYDDLEADDIGLPEAPGETHGAEVPMERALLDLEEKRTNDLPGTEE
jgi:hypothetical protein